MGRLLVSQVRLAELRQEADAERVLRLAHRIDRHHRDGRRDHPEGAIRARLGHALVGLGTVIAGEDDGHRAAAQHAR